MRRFGGISESLEAQTVALIEQGLDPEGTAVAIQLPRHGSPNRH